MDSDRYEYDGCDNCVYDAELPEHDDDADGQACGRERKQVRQGRLDVPYADYVAGRARTTEQQDYPGGRPEWSVRMG